MPATTQRRTFSEKLNGELKSRGMGARTLAKLLSARHGQTVENRRRAIIRWLQGHTPLAENRHLVEDALGLERDSLKGDDEDEDSSMPRTLEEALLVLVRRAVDDAILERSV